MRYTRTAAPATTPISLATAREWLAMETGVTADDAAVTNILNEVTAYLEQRWNGRKLINQTWTITLEEEEMQDEIPLRILPVSSVTSIVTYNDAGTASTVSSSNYHLTSGNRPRIVLKDSASWPTDVRWYDAMVITVVAGYGAAATDIPYDITMLIKGLVLHQYLSKGRGVAQTVGGQLIAIPNIYEDQINSYRLPPWA